MARKHIELERVLIAFRLIRVFRDIVKWAGDLQAKLQVLIAFRLIRVFREVVPGVKQ